MSHKKQQGVFYYITTTYYPRVAGFKQQQLDDLLYKDRYLIDGWDKMMSIVLAEDWPFLKRVRYNRSRITAGVQKK